MCSVDNLQETPIKEPKQSEEPKTPIQDQKTEPKSTNPSSDLRKSSTPYRLKVPKAFRYPERYRSPTDLMVSPVTKGLLARNRKAVSLLPPTINQPKVQDIPQELVSFKIEI